MKRLLIAPSVLSADFGRLAEEVGKVERAGADWIHVDVMDGHFVPNLTVGPAVVRSLKRRTKLPLDVHLMIERPERYVGAFAGAGARFLTVHVEAGPRMGDVIRLIRKLGCRPGMSLRPRTPVERLAPFLKELDLALVMTVEPGFGGQEFMPDMLTKVRWLKDRFRKLGKKAWVEVDGGINLATAAPAVRAGADVLVAGQAIFGRPDPGRALKEIRRAAVGGLS